MVEYAAKCYNVTFGEGCTGQSQREEHYYDSKGRNG